MKSKHMRDFVLGVMAAGLGASATAALLLGGTVNWIMVGALFVLNIVFHAVL